MKGNKIIDATSISQKTKRMAFQIYEDNFDQETIYVLGIKPAGYLFAKRLADMLSSISPIKVVLIAVDINKQNPLSSAENPFDNTIDLTDKNVLLVDDVANTGKTLYFALKPILHFLPKKVQTAVLVDRQHKLFPIASDYVGMRLSTTLQEHISVELSATASDQDAVYLI